MKVVISGYYGTGNTGDEAILESIITRLKKSNPKIRATVLSADPRATSKKFNVRSIRRFSVFQVVKEIMSCDTLISGGGGLLQDITGPLSIPYYLGIIWLGLLLKKKVAVMGQGYGPVKRTVNKWLVRNILNNVTLITVRDFGSFVALQKDRVNRPLMLIAADPAFLLEKGSIEELLKKENLDLGRKPLVGVCIRPLKHRSPDMYMRLASALDRIVEKHHANVIFIPFQQPVDADESANVASLMKHRPGILAQVHEAKDLMCLISKLDVLIGMRLHCLIFASVSHVPMIGIDYDPKVDNLMKEIDCPLLGLNFSADDMIRAFDEVYENRDHYVSLIKENAKILIKRAELNFSAFFEFADTMKEIYLFGVKVNNIGLEAAAEMIEGYIRGRKPRLVLSTNPEIIMAAQKDTELREIINSADIGIPDGIGVVGAAKLLNMPLIERVAGIDLMIRLLELSKEKGYKVFLLGSAPGVAEKAVKKLQGVNVVGTLHGYFRDNEEKDVIRGIKALRPDILFVGLGAPRQEKWLAKHYKELGIPVSMVIGGSLDVISGRAKRAPEIVRKIGLEWLYRLTKEPKRIKRQANLVKFIGHAIKHRLLGSSFKD
ncbi:MAG: polysaccharide pyruvyl transferase CsaB [Candidatus Saganbacteria bacterium]|nr:polysaccharide pyruvyl transferase CsaB [Candidatus Saganbacteria bacterium]